MKMIKIGYISLTQKNEEKKNTEITKGDKGKKRTKHKQKKKPNLLEINELTLNSGRTTK